MGSTDTDLIKAFGTPRKVAAIAVVPGEMTAALCR